MRFIRSVVALSLLSFSGVALASPPAAPATTAPEKKAASCEHGVKKALCTRCNPKLAPAFKAKGDWCAEHDRAESQCVICHPELAEKGVK